MTSPDERNPAVLVAEMATAKECVRTALEKVYVKTALISRGYVNTNSYSELDMAKLEFYSAVKASGLLLDEVENHSVFRGDPDILQNVENVRKDMLALAALMRSHDDPYSI